MKDELNLNFKLNKMICQTESRFSLDLKESRYE